MLAQKQLTAKGQTDLFCNDKNDNWSNTMDLTLLKKLKCNIELDKKGFQKVTES